MRQELLDALVESRQRMRSIAMSAMVLFCVVAIVSTIALTLQNRRDDAAVRTAESALERATAAQKKLQAETVGLCRTIDSYRVSNDAQQVQLQALYADQSSLLAHAAAYGGSLAPLLSELARKTQAIADSQQVTGRIDCDQFANDPLGYTLPEPRTIR